MEQTQSDQTAPDGEMIRKERRGSQIYLEIGGRQMVTTAPTLQFDKCTSAAGCVHSHYLSQCSTEARSAPLGEVDGHGTAEGAPEEERALRRDLRRPQI